MEKGRLEAFSDGVIAVIITIMVLELHVPHGNQLADLVPLLPKFLCYVLSFINVGLYWNNHHHLMQAAKHVNGRILWANLHVLFWMSLIPVTTDWMGENHFAQTPVILYGVVLLMCGVAYSFLVKALIAKHGKDSVLAQAIGRDKKGNISVLLYALAIALAFISSWIAMGLYLTVAAMWLIPDTRFEKIIYQKK
ncbi:TMEM175 family protein [Solimicrobium silvestre]|uniref:Putative integral membrane protein n=1 Tax=Solimicrobium silvestre TaxID=2099400 RepID=A0A2S9GTI3_9BURK|nr:TMEM175 family protein [Solimicrobium silvestre]PRC91011.1 putative integral membrane protein [Solimicrobium silvestre]